MQRITFVAAFLVLALATITSAKQEYRDGLPVVYNFQSGIDKCPAKFFWDDCNRCFCGKDGKTAGCTLMLCPPRHKREVDSDEVPVVYNYKAGDKCPAKFFKNDCNFCTCSEDGRMAACTLMACLPRDVVEKKEKKVIPRISNYKPGTKCPAKEFYISCNRCVCTKDGKNALCTLMACPEDQ